MPSSQKSKYAPTAWSAEKFVDLEFPSGQVAQVRRPGVPALVAAGILDNADALSTLVNEKHIKRVKGKTKIDAETLVRDKDNLLTVMKIVDKVTCHMVVQPEVRDVKVTVDGIERDILDDEREDGVVYVDQIDVQDRMFLFQYSVGGSTDLATFRLRFQAAMGGVAAGQDVPLPG